MQNIMNLEKATEVCRVSERTMRNACKRKLFGAKKKNGQWHLPWPLFYTPALTPKEIAQIVGLSQRQIEKLCHKKKLKSIKIGRQWRIEFRSGATFINDRLKDSGLWFTQRGGDE